MHFFADAILFFKCDTGRKYFRSFAVSLLLLSGSTAFAQSEPQVWPVWADVVDAANSEAVATANALMDLTGGAASILETRNQGYMSPAIRQFSRSLVDKMPLVPSEASFATEAAHQTAETRGLKQFGTLLDAAGNVVNFASEGIQAIDYAKRGDNYNAALHVGYAIAPGLPGTSAGLHLFESGGTAWNSIVQAYRTGNRGDLLQALEAGNDTIAMSSATGAGFLSGGLKGADGANSLEGDAMHYAKMAGNALGSQEWYWRSPVVQMLAFDANERRAMAESDARDKILEAQMAAMPKRNAANAALAMAPNLPPAATPVPLPETLPSGKPKPHFGSNALAAHAYPASAGNTAPLPLPAISKVKPSFASLSSKTNQPSRSAALDTAASSTPKSVAGPASLQSLLHNTGKPASRNVASTPATKAGGATAKPQAAYTPAVSTFRQSRPTTPPPPPRIAAALASNNSPALQNSGLPGVRSNSAKGTPNWNAIKLSPSGQFAQRPASGASVTTTFTKVAPQAQRSQAIASRPAPYRTAAPAYAPPPPPRM